MAGRRKRSESPHLAAASALSAAIRTRRTALGWSQQRLAERASIAYGTVRAVERCAVTEPGLFTIRSIADALGCRLDDLLDSDDAEARGGPAADGAPQAEQ